MDWMGFIALVVLAAAQVYIVWKLYEFGESKTDDSMYMSALRVTLTDYIGKVDMKLDKLLAEKKPTTFKPISEAHRKKLSEASKARWAKRKAKPASRSPESGSANPNKSS